MFNLLGHMPRTFGTRHLCLMDILNPTRPATYLPLDQPLPHRAGIFEATLTLEDSHHGHRCPNTRFQEIPLHTPTPTNPVWQPHTHLTLPVPRLLLSAALLLTQPKQVVTMSITTTLIPTQSARALFLDTTLDWASAIGVTLSVLVWLYLHRSNLLQLAIVVLAGTATVASSSPHYLPCPCSATLLLVTSLCIALPSFLPCLQYARTLRALGTRCSTWLGNVLPSASLPVTWRLSLLGLPPPPSAPTDNHETHTFVRIQGCPCASIVPPRHFDTTHTDIQSLAAYAYDGLSFSALSSDLSPTIADTLLYSAQLLIDLTQQLEPTVRWRYPFYETTRKLFSCECGFTLHTATLLLLHFWGSSSLFGHLPQPHTPLIHVFMAILVRLRTRLLLLSRQLYQDLETRHGSDTLYRLALPLAEDAQLLLQRIHTAYPQQFSLLHARLPGLHLATWSIRSHPALTGRDVFWAIGYPGEYLNNRTARLRTVCPLQLHLTQEWTIPADDPLPTTADPSYSLSLVDADNQFTMRRYRQTRNTPPGPYSHLPPPTQLLAFALLCSQPDIADAHVTTTTNLLKRWPLPDRQIPLALLTGVLGWYLLRTLAN